MKKIFFFLLVSSLCYSQSVIIDGNQISIGNNVLEVMQEFGKGYEYKVDTLKGFIISYTVLKSESIEGERITNNIADLYFSYTPKNLIISANKRDTLPTLFEIRNHWDFGSVKETSLSKFLKNLYNILDKNELDKYEININLSRYLEPNHELRTISLKLNKSHTIKIEFSDYGYFQITEVVTEAKNFPDYTYCLIFYDSKHLFQKNDFIYKIYTKEEDAERKGREYSTDYILKGFKTSKYKIIRFSKN